MIIPTPDFDPLFADDGVSFRSKMFDYIRREFADLVGPRLALLENEEGADVLSGANSPEIATSRPHAA